MTEEQMKQELDNSINVKEQIPELAEILEDYPLFDDHDFFVKVDSLGFNLYIGDMDLIEHVEYEAVFIFDCPTNWSFSSIRNVCLMWYEAELLYIFEDRCREICEIVKKFSDKKAA